MKTLITLLRLFPLFLLCSLAQASTFSLGDGTAIVGEVQHISAYSNDSTVKIAQRYNLGLNSIVDANPGLAEGSVFSSGEITVPTAFVLPELPRRGIIINLPEMRMYFYPPDSNTVMTFPIGIGRVGKTIPITNTAVTRKVVNPTWVPTPAIREFNRGQGIDLPREMPPGPDNPLGPYAIYMRVPTYLIHSTIFPESIGRRASFGCIRMNEDDIKQFFPLVTAGMPVAIIDMPVKAGWSGNHLYLQAYPPLEEKRNLSYGVLETVARQLPQHETTFINWQLIAFLSENPDGIPHDVGFRSNG